MGKFITLSQNGELKEHFMENFALPKIREIIDCDMADYRISPFNKFLSFKAVLLFDEEFLLKNEPQINKTASILFGYMVNTHEVLCGNVAIVKSVYIEDEGEDLELLTDEEIEEIKQLCQRIKRMQDMFVFELHKPEVIVRCL